MNQTVTIHHDLGDVVVRPSSGVKTTRLKTLLRATLNHYAAHDWHDWVAASVIHAEAARRHGAYYQTAGYYLCIYRWRADLTQAQFAEKMGLRRRHISDMENNKREIGETNAHKFATVLNCDYRKLI